jgi:hypothetical protein
MALRSCSWSLGACLIASLAGCGEEPAESAGVRGGAGSNGSAAGTGSGGSAAGEAGAGNTVGAQATAGSAGAGSAGTAGAAGTGTGGAPISCGVTPEGLKVSLLATTAIATMGTPFDTDGDDTSPWSRSTNYGSAPEIVALPDGENVDVLWQDHSSDPKGNQDDPNKNAKKAFVVHIEKGAAGYAVTRAYQVDQLAHIMGLAKDELGNYYVATGVDEDADLTPTVPAEGMHRPGIVKLIKFDQNGCKLLEIDADVEREKADAESEPIINPMVAATSRLAYHGGRLALLHGINTGYDANVDARHQKALTTHFDAMTGAVTRASSMWVSHSFDQRLFWDGIGFTELHLGDAYPRAIALGRFNDAQDGTETYELFKPKGEEGANDTYTRLGGIAPIATGDFGYLVVFSTDRGAETAAILNGTRDVAFVRVSRGFAEMDETGSTYVDGNATQSVTSSGEPVSNKLSWLTDYAADSAQADRPRVAAAGAEQFVVLWERWTGTSDQQSQFDGLHGLVLGADGLVKVAPKLLGQQHLSRGDDVVPLGARAAFVSGSAASKKLSLNLIGADLALETIEIP